MSERAGADEVDARKYGNPSRTTLIVIEVFRRAERAARTGVSLTHGQILKGLKHIEPGRVADSACPEDLEQRWVSKAFQEGYLQRPRSGGGREAGGVPKHAHYALTDAARLFAPMPEREPAMKATG